jgi:hypothetical protein
LRNLRKKRDPDVQRSLFGEILDWMLAPLLFVWPISIAFTHYFANSVASFPYDQSLREHVTAISRQVTFDDGRPQLAMPALAQLFLRSDEIDNVYFHLLDGDGALVVGDPELPVPVVPISLDGPWRYGRDNERLQLLSASSRRDFETKAASNKTSTVPTFVFGLRLPGRHVRVRPGSLRTRPDLDRAHNQRFVMAPPTFALRGATDPRLVQFDRPFATDSVTLRTNHRRSQFMQHLESGLVTSEPKLSLKLQSAHSGSLGCHKVGRPEPDVKRLSRALHDGPGREAGLGEQRAWRGSFSR